MDNEDIDEQAGDGEGLLRGFRELRCRGITKHQGPRTDATGQVANSPDSLRWCTRLTQDADSQTVIKHDDIDPRGFLIK